MSRLEGAAYVSIIVVCAVALYSLISPRFDRPSRIRAEASESALVGKPVHLGGIPWAESHTALVLAITSQCPYCLRSLPLYRRLDRLARDGKQGVSLFVVSPEPTETIQTFLSDEQIKPLKVLHSSLAALGVQATPTLLIIDQSGIVRRVFVGQLNEQREGQLMDALDLKLPAAPAQHAPTGSRSLTQGEPL